MIKDNKKCVLHIGAPKTGSTSLEKFLFGNQDKLTENGWFYPCATVRGYGHHDLAYLVSGSYPDWALPQDKTFDELLEELHNAITDHSKIILSSEIYYMYSKPADVAKMLEYLGIPIANVRIILYIRRQDEAHLSWYNQRVKAQGYTDSINNSIDDSFGLWDYRQKLSPWQKVFGRDSITLRIYEKEKLAGGDVRNDFLTAIDVEVSGFQWPEQEVNTRLCSDILEFQRLVNKLPLEPLQKRKFREKLMLLSESSKNTGLFDDLPLLDNNKRERILESYAKSNAEVARDYFQRDLLFDDAMPNHAEKTTARCGLDVEKLGLILGWILLGQQDRD